MAVIRGPNRSDFGNEPTRRVRAPDPYAERTVVARRSSEAPTRALSPDRSGEDEVTRLVAARPAAPPSQPRDFMDDPVVGWLVVVDGPGKGQSLRLGYGQNAIGRAAGQRVQLDFGDEQISREAHAFISYDPRGRRFYVSNGAGANLTYIKENPVLAPTEIAANTELTIGRTTLRFLPFCGGDFDWRQEPRREGA